jgi:hypothetical protein
MVVFPSGGRPSQRSNDLSREQAKPVVQAYLKSQQYNVQSSKFDLESEPDDADSPEFYMFHAYFDTDTRLNSIGTYAVSRKTATLWERVACEELKSKAVEQLQERLRKELGLLVGDRSRTKPCF